MCLPDDELGTGQARDLVISPHTHGALQLHSPEVKAFDKYTLALLTTLAPHFTKLR